LFFIFSTLHFISFRRLVTLSFAPFTVVHVNAAYMRMTGLSSVDTLGRPFHELLEDEVLVAALQSQGEIDSLETIHDQVLQAKTASDKNGFHCQVTVSPVGPGPQSISHFALELAPVDSRRTGGSSVGSEPVPSNAFSMVVMG
jgi:PAS fold